MAADPLDSIRRQIAAASSLPTPEPYVRSTDPLDRLNALLRGDAANDDRATDATPRAVGGDGIEAIVGREVLAMAGSQPLSAAARQEAIRRLAVAAQNPTSENVRSALAVLVTGRTDA